MSRRCWATIDLGALRHNLQQVGTFAPGTNIMAAVKANAYGHGAIPCAKALAQADALAVASMAEALELRQAGVDKPIVLLGGVLNSDELEEAADHGLQLVVHDDFQLKLLEQAKPSGRIRVWGKLDTGMHRLGFLPEQVRQVHGRLRALPSVELQGWMTHFASADALDLPVTTRQIEVFNQALKGLPGRRSLANSAGIVAWPDSHADWVRPGIMLYGASPVQGRAASELGLKPVMTLRARVLSIRELPAAEPVGYGGTWTTPEPMRVAVLAIGYADGYPRHAPNGTPVLVNGCRVPLVGRVSMDMITVDLRGLDTVHEGDEAVLWGQGLPADEVALAAGTIAYELFCQVGRRVEFDYLQLS